MWTVNNATDFKAERVFSRDREGAETWIVAVRATFLINDDGEISVAAEQQDVCLAPKYFGEPGMTSLLYDMDLVRTKPGTDIFLHANAYAPDGDAVPFVDVGFTVGAVSKELRVFGDRTWRRAGRTLVPGEPEPFLKLPIRYERSWGGPMPETNLPYPFNPVGVGASAAKDSSVPNVEHPDNPIGSSDHGGLPAGFGPIPVNWHPRATFAGSYDETWKKERQPLVPKDFQDEYFSCAPADQRANGFLKGGEEVMLRNLSRDGLMRFRLPRINLGFSTRIDGGIQHHRALLHTVIIEPEQRKLILVWHTSLECHHSLYTLNETLVFEKERLNTGAGASLG
jgi:hypothetical protein